jgi:putative PIN family toxin of toxin-antitoxin system
VKRSTAGHKPTVLIDTNILISGLVFLEGNEHRILKLAEEKAIALILPDFVLEEAGIVLTRRFPGHEALLDAFLSRIQHTVIPWREIEQPVSLYKKKVRDTKDAPVLAAVVVAKPDFTVTGDLSLREDMRCCTEVARITSVCSSRQFLKEMFKRRR